MNYKIEKFNIKDYVEVKKIYKNSFKKENRFSLANLTLNVILKRANIYVLHIGKEVAAFIYIITYKNECFILYLAVKEEYRNKGVGSYLLKWYLKNNEKKQIFLNIDEVNKIYDDYLLRKKRLNFYLKNNFCLTNYLAFNRSSKGNILSNKKIFDVEQYKIFDKKISKWFFCKNDNIKCNKNNEKEGETNEQ